MNSISDQLADLSDEDQRQFYAEAQRHLRREWARAKNRTEIETQTERNQNAKCK